MYGWVGIHATIKELSCRVKKIIHLLNIYTRFRIDHNSIHFSVIWQVFTDEANRLIEIYNNEGIVCPMSPNGTLFGASHTNGNVSSNWRLAWWEWLDIHHDNSWCHHWRKSSGTTERFTRIKGTMGWEHQVSASALFILLKKAFEEYQHTTQDVELLSFDDWSKHMASTRPQFHYWYNVLQLELLFLKFLISQRDPNFDMDVESLGKIIPWMFALDHYRYARWMTIRVKGLLELQLTCRLNAIV